MHGKYSTPGLVKADVSGLPAFLVLNGLGFSLIDENSPVAFYQTTINEADFAALVLTRTNDKPRETHIPAITVDGVQWWHASERGHWIGKLAVNPAKDAIASGAATTDESDVRAVDVWADVRYALSA